MQRYPRIHNPKKPVSQPQIATPVVGEGWRVRMAGGGYGHVILQLEPNPDNDGCFMLWSVTSDAIRDIHSEGLLTTQFLDDVYRGLCKAIVERRFHGFWQGFRVPNACILKMEFGSGGIPCWSSFITDHLPPELQTAMPDATVAINAGDQPS